MAEQNDEQSRFKARIEQLEQENATLRGEKGELGKELKSANKTIGELGRALKNAEKKAGSEKGSAFAKTSDGVEIEILGPIFWQEENMAPEKAAKVQALVDRLHSTKSHRIRVIG